MNVFGGILESACLSVRLFVRSSICPSIHVSVCVQNTSVCQSAGRGIMSHSVKSRVLPEKNNFFLIGCYSRSNL